MRKLQIGGVVIYDPRYPEQTAQVVLLVCLLLHWGIILGLVALAAAQIWVAVAILASVYGVCILAYILVAEGEYKHFRYNWPALSRREKILSIAGVILLLLLALFFMPQMIWGHLRSPDT